MSVSARHTPPRFRVYLPVAYAGLWRHFPLCDPEPPSPPGKRVGIEKAPHPVRPPSPWKGRLPGPSVPPQSLAASADAHLRAEVMALLPSVEAASSLLSLLRTLRYVVSTRLEIMDVLHTLQLEGSLVRYDMVSRPLPSLVPSDV